MKTLIVAPFSPYPLVFGGAIRLYHLVKMFASISDVTLLAYASWQDDENPVQHLETICDKVVMVDNAPLRTHKKRWLQMQATFSPRTFQYYAYYSRHFQQALDAVLQEQQFDCIVAEQTQMGYFTYRQPGALRILDLQNIEYELLARRAQVERQPLKKLAMQIEARKFKREELALCQLFDLVFTTSERERDQLRPLLGTTRVECLPNSIDPDYFALRSHTPPTHEITFIGTTHVDANRDGLCYFMDAIFPLIEQRVPDVHFSIVGGNPPPVIREYGQRPNVDVTGYVKDVRTYMERARVLVVPLRSGGGTRLKILEGLSFGVPTVSTSIGSEGINLVDGEHILLGDTPQAFADQVVRVLQDDELQARLRQAGRTLVEEHYSWQAVGRSLGRYLRETFEQRQGSASVPSELIVSPTVSEHMV